MTLDTRIQSLEDELKLIKAEIQTTLIDLRDILSKEELSSGPPKRTPRAEEAPLPDMDRRGTTPEHNHLDPVAAPRPEASPSQPVPSTASFAHLQPPVSDGAPSPANGQVGRHIATLPAPAASPAVDPAFDWRVAIPAVPGLDGHAPLGGFLPIGGGVSSGASQGRVPSQDGAHPSPSNGRAAADPEAAGAYGRGPHAAAARHMAPDPARPHDASGISGLYEAWPAARAQPDLRLLVGALRWAAAASACLGREGPRRVIDAYEAIWPLPDPVKRVFTAAMDLLGGTAGDPPAGSSTTVADDFILLLLSLHGLLHGGPAAGVAIGPAVAPTLGPAAASESVGASVENSPVDGVPQPVLPRRRADAQRSSREAE